METFYNTQTLERSLLGAHRSEPGCTWYLARKHGGQYCCLEKPPRAYDQVERIFFSANNERFAERVGFEWVERPDVLERGSQVVRELRRALDSLADAMESCEVISLDGGVRREIESKLSAVRKALRETYNAEVQAALKDVMERHSERTVSPLLH